MVGVGGHREGGVFGGRVAGRHHQTLLVDNLSIPGLAEANGGEQALEEVGSRPDGGAQDAERVPLLTGDGDRYREQEVFADRRGDGAGNGRLAVEDGAEDIRVVGGGRVRRLIGGDHQHRVGVPVPDEDALRVGASALVQPLQGIADGLWSVSGQVRGDLRAGVL